MQYSRSLFIALGILSLSLATLEGQSKLTATETKFVQEAIQSGRHEVEAAHMALTQGADSSVKGFAQRLVNDHSAANRKLEEIARENTVTIPAVSGSTVHPDLATLKGTGFDREFVKQMVAGHEMAIAKFEAAQKSATNAGLKNFITSTLPTLRQHLDQARELNKT